MPRIPQPRALNPNLLGLEIRIQKSWHAVKKYPQITGVMVQMVEIKSGIRKTLFSG
jgi:hypothetical protein